MSFAGVSVVTAGKHCTTWAVNGVTDNGYHLLVVKDYSRTVQDIPNGQNIRSGPFMVGGHQWCIEYYPNGDDPDCADFMSLYVRHGDENIENNVETEAEFEFTFVDDVENQKSMQICAKGPHRFSVNDPDWGYDKFIKRDVLELSAHLKEDCFTIRCDIMVCNDLNTNKDAVGTRADIGQHFKILLQDKLGSDVTFEVGSELFAAHRCVLAARSKVFKAQLFGPMMEGITSGVIQIKDMESKVFAALLSFIYTDSFPKMEKDTNMEEGQDEEKEGQDGADEEQDEEEEVKEGEEHEAADHVTWLQWLQALFIAADRYDIQQLKFLCEKKLSEHIGVSSVASTLALAEQHQCHGLKEACLKFVQVQSLPCLEKVMETDGWEHIRTTYPSVLKELFSKVASNQKKDKKRKR
ncbi:unnamed protein product [Alopecurus aequalis]